MKPSDRFIYHTKIKREPRENLTVVVESNVSLLGPSRKTEERKKPMRKGRKGWNTLCHAIS